MKPAYFKTLIFPIKTFLRPLFLISFGGMFYYNFEILCRGYSHFSMIICGGLCFYFIGLMNEGKKYRPPFVLQMFYGSLIILFLEYFTGVIVNIRLCLHVWDYTGVPFNYQGQICLPYFVLWFLLTPVCILGDDVIRWALFAGQKSCFL